MIAKSDLFEYVNGEWKEFGIIIHKPAIDSDHPDDYFCLIEIGHDNPRKVYGIDSLQTIILAVGALGNRMKELKAGGLRLYHSRQTDQEVDIDVFLRNDLSFFRNMKPDTTNKKNSDRQNKV